MKQEEKFIWSCGYSNFHPDNDFCHCCGERNYDTKEDAARAGLMHKHHAEYVSIYSTKNGYIGLASGINFNAPKTIGLSY
jgi:hypothetical protein